MQRSPRDLMRAKERRVLTASCRIGEDDLKRTYAMIKRGELTSTGEVRSHEDDDLAAAVERLLWYGNIEGVRWRGWRRLEPMFQDLRVSVPEKKLPVLNL